jgi:hypothetical protein
MDTKTNNHAGFEPAIPANKWPRPKRLHGHFPRSFDEGLINKEQSYRCTNFRDIKGETESAIMAAHDQAISTNYFKEKILKQEIESKCRLCKEYEETIDHLASQVSQSV